MSKFIKVLSLIGGISLCSSQYLSATTHGDREKFKQDEPSSIRISHSEILKDFEGLDK